MEPWIAGFKLVDQVLNGIGDLELAPGGRLDPPDGLEDRRVEPVDAYERQVALPAPTPGVGVVDLGDARVAAPDRAKVTVAEPDGAPLTPIEAATK